MKNLLLVQRRLSNSILPILSFGAPKVSDNQQVIFTSLFMFFLSTKHHHYHNQLSLFCFLIITFHKFFPLGSWVYYYTIIQIFFDVLLCYIQFKLFGFIFPLMKMIK
jgi:hypothetical protein